MNLACLYIHRQLSVFSNNSVWVCPIKLKISMHVSLHEHYFLEHYFSDICQCAFMLIIWYFVKNGIRHQLQVSGINRISYWISHLIGHLLMCILSLIVLLICIAVINIKSLNMSASLFLLSVAFVLHLLGNLLFVYTFSFISSTLTKILYPVSLLCNIITLDIMNYLVPDPWRNSNFYSPSWFTVSFTVRGMPFFLPFLFHVHSELADWSVYIFEYLF